MLLPAISRLPLARIRSAACALGFLALGATRALGQQSARTIRLQVVDSSRSPIANATIVVTLDGAVVALGRTDSAGGWSIPLSADSGRYELSIRRIGFAPILAVTVADSSAALTVTMARIAATIDTIVVREAALPKSKQPYIDASEIAATKRALYSLGDVIHKLRPDLYYQAHRCVAPMRLYVNGRWLKPPVGRIRPEHIQEVRYVVCFDNSIEGLPPYGGPRMFAVLKPGIAYTYNDGTFDINKP